MFRLFMLFTSLDVVIITFWRARDVHYTDYRRVYLQCCQMMESSQITSINCCDMVEAEISKTIKQQWHSNEEIVGL